MFFSAAFQGHVNSWKGSRPCRAELSSKLLRLWLRPSNSARIHPRRSSWSSCSAFAVLDCPWWNETLRHWTRKKNFTGILVGPWSVDPWTLKSRLRLELVTQKFEKIVENARNLKAWSDCRRPCGLVTCNGQRFAWDCHGLWICVQSRQIGLERKWVGNPHHVTSSVRTASRQLFILFGSWRRDSHVSSEA